MTSLGVIQLDGEFPIEDGADGVGGGPSAEAEAVAWLPAKQQVRGPSPPPPWCPLHADTC